MNSSLEKPPLLWEEKKGKNRLQKSGIKDIIPNSFFEANIILVNIKASQRHYKKTRLISLMNTDPKIHNKI